jgi:hypothetical protein
MKKFLIIGIGIIFVIAAPLYLFLKHSHHKLFPDYDSMMHYDPERMGGHLVPNLNTYFQGEKKGQKIKVITNKQGFRNEKEFDPDVPPNTIRVLLLGDSYVDGYRTDQKQTIGYITEKLLNQELKNQKKAFKSVEVMISGHNNPADAWYYYQEHGYKYHPHLVVLGVTLGNDITWNNYKTGVVPIKNTDGSTSLSLIPNSRADRSFLEGLPLPKDAYLIRSTKSIRLLDLELKIINKMAKISYIFGDFIPPASGPLPNSIYHIYANDLCNSLGLFYQPIMPEIENMLHDFEEVLSGFRQRVEANGGKFLVVLFPIRIQVSQRDWSLFTKFNFLTQSKFDLYYPNRRIINYCMNKNITIIDLTSEFIKSRNKHLYRANGDMHFNEAGQELAARVIAKRINNILNK